MKTKPNIAATLRNLVAIASRLDALSIHYRQHISLDTREQIDALADQLRFEARQVEEAVVWASWKRKAAAPRRSNMEVRNAPRPDSK